MCSKRHFTCKYPDEIHELMVIHPYALIVFAGLVAYCHDRSYPSPILTSIARTPEENEADGAESDSHVTLRAFDISSRPYTLAQIEDICAYMKNEFKQYAAVNAKGANRLVVYHKVDKGAMHFHFQIHRRFSLPEFKGMN
jgi:hypothetical protein